MAWALRASTPGNGTIAATGTYTVTLGAACSVDDRVVVTVTVETNSVSAPSVTPVTGTFCGTFTKDVETAQYTVGTFRALTSTWSAPVTSAGTPVISITVSLAGGSGGSSAGAAAFSGLSNAVGATAVDVSAANQKNSGIDALPTVTTATTNAANELVAGGFGDAGETLTFTAGSGYTTSASAQVSNGNADAALEWKDSGGTGTQVVNGTWSATTEWGAAAAVYKLSGGAVQNPFTRRTDPNPIARMFPIDGRTFIDATEFWLFAGKDTQFGGPGRWKTYDYPNPTLKRDNINRRTWTDWHKLMLIGRDVLPFAQSDWPNPTLKRDDVNRRTHWWNPLIQLLTVVVLAPFAMLDWPNPLRRTHPHQGFADSYKQPLVGTDALPFRLPDWLNPWGRRPLHQDHRDSYKPTLTGQDALPFSQTNWPNPQPPRQNERTGFWQAPMVLLTAVVAAVTWRLFGIGGHANTAGMNPPHGGRNDDL